MKPLQDVSQLFPLFFLRYISIPGDTREERKPDSQRKKDLGAKVQTEPWTFKWLIRESYLYQFFNGKCANILLRSYFWLVLDIIFHRYLNRSKQTFKVACLFFWSLFWFGSYHMTAFLNTVEECVFTFFSQQFYGINRVIL